MDKQGMTLDELKRNVQIDPVLLDRMYNEGLFDDTKVGIGNSDTENSGRNTNYFNTVMQIIRL